MSASLVGSEMCIRDRFQWNHYRNRAPYLKRHMRTAMRLNRFTAYTLQTVSYTHLTLPTICSV
eukprot:4148140-Alexandrium_andersonii.AAC.1